TDGSWISRSSRACRTFTGATGRLLAARLAPISGLGRLHAYQPLRHAGPTLGNQVLQGLLQWLHKALIAELALADAVQGHFPLSGHIRCHGGFRQAFDKPDAGGCGANCLTLAPQETAP